jgi:transposase-like protein
MERITIRVPSTFKARFERAAKFRGMTVKSWLRELAESDASQFVVNAPKFALEPVTQKSADQNLPTDVHSKKLSPEAVQKLLHLSQTMSLNELARRFNISPTTCARYVRNYSTHGRANGPHSLTASRKYYRRYAGASRGLGFTVPK